MKRELELRREEEEKGRVEAREEGIGGLDDERLREIYGGDAQAFVDGFADPGDVGREKPERARKSEKWEQEEVPLWDLFRNYVYRAAQDRRNITILVLSLVVLLLSTSSLSGSKQHSAQVPQPKNHMEPEPSIQLPKIVSDAISTTSTSIITSTSTSMASTPSMELKHEQQGDQDEAHDSSWTEVAEEVFKEMLED